ncbi:MAG: penicillin acylase family protein [Alphaproteobacteria bacterium]|nr:penicillin acylase family protein [Alphaproteobacteria bacterium]
MTYDATPSARPATSRATGAVKGKVEILRDRMGVPHVYAGRTDDLFFGLGLAVAEDRLWQMDRLRRRALGRQAEILGEAYLNLDIAHRTLGLDRIAIEETSKLDGKTYEECAAYVAGINRQIEIFGRKLPPEFKAIGYEPEAFKVSDLVAIARGLWWSLNGRIDRLTAAEAAKLLPEAFRAIYLTPEAAEHLVLPAGDSLAAGSDDQTGSNNWASSGRISKSGKAGLAGDPHQPFWVPSSWWEYGVHGPEDDAAGAGHPGFPGLWWGSNGTVAWAITNNMASTRDLYREETSAKKPGQYLDGDTWREFETHTETIQVKGGKAKKLVVRRTVRGPIVNDLVPLVDDPKTHAPISLRWSSLEHLDDLRSSIGLSRVKSFKEFRDNLRDWGGAVFNFVYADVKGNVGYQMAGRVPVRGRVTYGLRDANNPKDRWKGHIPFDALPYSYNPKRGYVASANQRIVPPDYPQVIYGAYAQAHRGIRIDQVFGEGKWDTSRSIRLQNDVKNVRAERVVPGILKALKGSADADAKAVHAALKSWDYFYTLESIAPTVFETFMFHWQRRVLGEHMPDRLLDLTMQQTNLGCHLLAKPNSKYFKNSTVVAEAEKAAKQAIATLNKRLGANPKKWNWGAIHIAHWKHPLSNAENTKSFDIGPRAADGGSHTVRNMGGELPPHAASSGAEYRIIVDFAKPRSFRATQNIGNSGVPGNPHYRDQFDAFLDGEYHTVSLDRAAIEADLESKTEIKPS